MVPARSDVPSRFDVELAVRVASGLTLPHPVEPANAFDVLESKRRKVAPVVDASGRLVGVMTRTGALRSTIYRPALDAQGQLRVAAAMGVNGDVKARAEELLETGVD